MPDKQRENGAKHSDKTYNEKTKGSGNSKGDTRIAQAEPEDEHQRILNAYKERITNLGSDL